MRDTGQLAVLEQCRNGRIAAAATCVRCNCIRRHLRDVRQRTYEQHLTGRREQRGAGASNAFRQGQWCDGFVSIRVTGNQRLLSRALSTPIDEHCGGTQQWTLFRRRRLGRRFGFSSSRYMRLRMSREITAPRKVATTDVAHKRPHGVACGCLFHRPVFESLIAPPAVCLWPAFWSFLSFCYMRHCAIKTF